MNFVMVLSDIAANIFGKTYLIASQCVYLIYYYYFNIHINMYLYIYTHTHTKYSHGFLVKTYIKIFWFVFFF